MPTHYPGTPEEVRALNTYIKLTRAAESVLSRTTAHLGAHDLTPTQFAVLEALYHLGTLSQVVLARKLLKSTGNMTVVLQNLEKRGLITRERDAGDQRIMQVTITEAGRQLIECVLPAHVRGIVDDLSVLSAAEQETLGRLCRRLGRRQTTDGQES